MFYAHMLHSANGFCSCFSADTLYSHLVFTFLGDCLNTFQRLEEDIFISFGEQSNYNAKVGHLAPPGGVNQDINFLLPLL